MYEKKRNKKLYSLNHGSLSFKGHKSQRPINDIVDKFFLHLTCYKDVINLFTFTYTEVDGVINFMVGSLFKFHTQKLFKGQSLYFWTKKLNKLN